MISDKVRMRGSPLVIAGGFPGWNLTQRMAVPDTLVRWNTITEAPNIISGLKTKISISKTGSLL